VLERPSEIPIRHDLRDGIVGLLNEHLLEDIIRIKCRDGGFANLLERRVDRVA
jgi:hypothetical protein